MEKDITITLTWAQAQHIESELSSWCFQLSGWAGPGVKSAKSAYKTIKKLNDAAWAAHQSALKQARPLRPEDV